jgi:hypothetical protein
MADDEKHKFRRSSSGKINEIHQQDRYGPKARRIAPSGDPGGGSG